MHNFQKLSTRAILGLAAFAGFAALALPADAASRRDRSFVALYDTPTIDVVPDGGVVGGYLYEMRPYSKAELDCAINGLARKYPAGVNFSLLPEYHEALATVCR